MLHVTFFSGTEGELPLSNFVSFTLFGRSRLRRPTLARRLLRLKSVEGHTPTLFERLFEVDRNILITLFGTTRIAAPTLMEEFSDLRGVVGSGSLTVEEGRRLLGSLAAGSGSRDLYTGVTLFGCCRVRHPSVDEERKALDAAASAGILSDHERRELDSVIGRPTREIAGFLGQLVFRTA